MFKSSLATHSSIDHDLFPLLTVRSCVSEADESKNGPRFCAEDKMTGGAYEIRSRKLALEADDGGSDNGASSEPHNRRANRNLSPHNLGVIKRQQDRINALLSASAHCSVPACVSLPIDVYIQEQPSTGDTYVASVDAFSGLSLGDIIRSGWGIMEECVFLEILNTVEAFGYASAGLPPHGNLSCDAIKQLLIVRDGASEARQPSRWVVSDWLLLSDATVTSFDPQAFVADLEWVLHSSFAQLHISSAAAQGSTVMSASRVEELVSETVERIRAHLLRQADTADENASGASPTPTVAAGAAPDAAQQADPAASTSDADASSHAHDSGTATLPRTSQQLRPRHVDPTMSLDGGSNNASGLDSTESVNAAAQGATRGTSSSPAPSTTPPQARGGDGGDGGDSGGGSGGAGAVPRAPSPNTSASEFFVNKARGGPTSGDSGAADAQAASPLAQMSLKDKMAYHQAALRNEQLLVNKHRRKNAPLPPRPQPLSPQTKKARLMLSPSAFEDDEQYAYEPPSRTSPIEVKPSAYLMQGHRPAAGASTRVRKAQSPRSGRTPTTEARTPRENSRSTTTPPHSQTHVPTTPRQSGGSRDQQRERLLDDVVSMAVMNQRRRMQDHREQAEAERQRREEWQQALLQSSSSAGAASRRAVGGVARAMPALLEKPRTATTTPPTTTTASATAHTATTASNAYGAATATSAQGKAVKGGEGGARRGSGVPGGGATSTSNAGAPVNSTSDRLRALSESPEPRPPSPHAYRVVHPTIGGAGPAARPAPARGGRGGVSGRGAAPAAAAATVGPPRSARGAPAGVGHRHMSGPTAATPLRSARGRGAPTTAAASGTAAAPPRAAQPPQQPAVPPRDAAAKAPPVVKPLPLSSVLGNIAAQRAAGSSGAANGTAGADVRPPHDAAATPGPGKKTPGGSPRFSNRSPRTGVLGPPPKFGAGGGSPRWPNTARPPPGPPYAGFSPRTFRRVSSTGMMGPPRYFAQTTASRGRMPANRIPVRAPAPAPAHAAAAPAPHSAPSKQQEQPRSARARGPVVGSPRAEVAAPLRTTTPRPRVAADVDALSPAQRKAISRLAPRKVRPRPADDPTSRGEVSAAAPAVPGEPCAATAASPTARPAATTAVRRGTRAAGPLQTSRTGAENRTPRDRGAGGAYGAAAGSSSSAKAASPKGPQRQKHGNVRGGALGLRTEPLTLGSVRPVNETSPGILLRRQHSATV